MPITRHPETTPSSPTRSPTKQKYCMSSSSSSSSARKVRRTRSSVSRSVAAHEEDSDRDVVPVSSDSPSPLSIVPNQVEEHERSMSPSIEFSKRCIDLAEQYLQNCRQFDITVDPSVVIALRTGWSILQPSRKFTEGSMLPLLGILDNCSRITKLNLSNITMQDSRYSN